MTSFYSSRYTGQRRDKWACLGIMYCLVKHTLGGLYFGTQTQVTMAMKTKF